MEDTIYQKNNFQYLWIKHILFYKKIKLFLIYLKIFNKSEELYFIKDVFCLIYLFILNIFFKLIYLGK